MTEDLRFGIIGCGVIGQVHADAIERLPGSTLVAVADSEGTRADDLARRYKIHSYDSVQEMLDREDLDVVTIATPSGLHAAQAIQVMRSGRHVIVEKPMDITLEAVDEMLRVQQEAGVKMAVISQRRFDPAARRVRSLVEQGAFGRLVAGNAHVLWWRSQEYYDSGGWRGTWSMDGGGILMNQSIHSIDLLQWFMGPVRSVLAYTATLVHEMETEDTGVAALRFESGALGTIVGTTGAYPGITARVEILGDRGSAVLEEDVLTHLRYVGDGEGEVGPYGTLGKHPHAGEEDGMESEYADNPHSRQFADMVDAIRSGGAPLLDGYGARHPVEIILAIYESARTGKEVVLG
jgi:UDP-N-acetyl-2-amino-2-deoxyglucuronate dehydrogenase